MGVSQVIAIKDVVIIKHKDDDDLDEEQAMLVGNYKNYLRTKKFKMRRYGGNKPYRKRFCYECVDIGHLAADCPNKGKKSRYNKQVTRSTWIR